MNAQFHMLYLDNGEHSLVVVWVSLDLKALCGISIDYRVDCSPCSCGWVVSIIYCQVDHHARHALVHVGLKLSGGKQTRQITVSGKERQ